MKGIRITALTERGKAMLKKQASEKLKAHQRMFLSQIFKKSFDGEKVYTLELKNKMVGRVLKFKDLRDRTIDSFVEEGCKASDFRVEELKNE